MKVSTSPVQKLLLMIAPPFIWVIHFLAVYPAGAVICEKLQDAPEDTARIVAYGASLVALSLIGLVGIVAAGDLRGRDREPAFDARTRESQSAFLSRATLLLAALSAIAVVYGTLPAIFSASCR